MKIRIAHWAGLVLILSCQSGDKGFNPQNTELLRVSGNNQKGEAGTTLVEPLVVRVTDKKGQGQSGATVQFSLISGNPSGGRLSVESAVTDADGKASTTLTLGDAGNYKVQFQVVGGSQKEFFDAVAIAPPPPPVATIKGISGPPPSGVAYEGDLVSFVGEGSDPEDGILSGASLVWSSDIDGKLGEGERFQRALSAGYHTITLTATDSKGKTGIDSDTLTVRSVGDDGEVGLFGKGGDSDTLTVLANAAPVATIKGISGPPPSGVAYEGDLVSFVGEGNDPEDGVLSGALLVWTSDIDGKLGEGGRLQHALSAGHHTITLTATDSKGKTGIDSDTLTVLANATPAATIKGISGPPPSGVAYEGDLVSFVGEGSDPEDGVLSGASLVWTSSIDGKLGEGERFQQALSEGYHTITLTATDSKGKTGIDSDTLTVLASGEIALPANTVNVSLSLPANVKPEETSILSGVEETIPAAGGHFLVSPPEIHRLTTVLDKEGNPFLLALLPPSESAPRVDTQTTATTLVFFAAHLYTTPPALWPEAIAILEKVPEVEQLARVLGERLEVSTAVLVEPDAQFETALEAAILAVNAELGRLAGAGKVTPSGPVSQVRLVHPADGQNEALVEVRNFGRRYLSLYADRTSPSAQQVLANEVVGPAHEPVSFSTLGNWLNSNRDPSGFLSPKTKQYPLSLVSGSPNIFQVEVVGASFRGISDRSEGYWTAWGYTFGDFVLLKLLKVFVGLDLPEGSKIEQWQEWGDLVNKLVLGFKAGGTLRGAVEEGSVWGILDSGLKLMEDKDIQEAVVGVVNRAIAKQIGIVALGKMIAGTAPWVKALKIGAVVTDYGFIGYSLAEDNPEEQFTIEAEGPNQSPTASISSPANGSAFTVGDAVSFRGSGSDAAGGSLSGSALVWQSSLDGQIGTGVSFTRSNLSVGTHTITLTATDSKGATGTATVEITVTASSGIAASQSLIFILDLSGSMNDLESSGVPRLQVAKEALEQVLSAASGAREYALVTFGGSCAVATPVPFTADPQAVSGYAGNLSADGSTPLAEALRTAQHLALDQASSDDVQLVLLSDGQETCGGDPIAVAQDIAAGRRAKPAKILARVIRLNAIGLGVASGSADEQQIQAIAAAAGGNYYRVSQPQDLAAALGQASGLQTASSTLSGKVTDSQGQALSGAAVRLLNHPDLREQTDANGTYRFPASFQGVDSLIVEATGYLRYATEVYVSNRTYDVRLTPSAALLPVAVAQAEPASVEPGGQMTLRGGESSDPSGGSLIFHWSQMISNPFTVTFSANDSRDAFAVRVTLQDVGIYHFVLVVENEQGLESAPDTVEVEVSVPFSGTALLPNGAQMEFEWIEPGTFMMGSRDSDTLGRGSERPQHQVTLTQGFWLGRYEITQGQWEAVMGTRPWSGQFFVEDSPSYPAESISWDDIQVFINKLNQMAGHPLYRLPTEAEWEYACRAGTTTRWSFGNDENQLGNYAWYVDNAQNEWGAYAHRGGTKASNGWILFDMHGNLWEWVQDRYGDYSGGAQTDPQGPSAGSRRVMRGGSCVNSARETRSARRDSGTPVDRYGFVGARLLRIK